VLCHGPRVLLINILRSELNVDQSGVDLGVTHELHERGEADAGADHIRCKCVSKPVRVSLSGAGGSTVMAEQ
jgi:hypothetical protein